MEDDLVVVRRGHLEDVCQLLQSATTRAERLCDDEQMRDASEICPSSPRG